MPRPFVNFKLWGVQAKFTGNDIGAYYTPFGRGGKPIQRQFNVLEGAVVYQPKLAVQSLTQGLQVSGTYGTQPLAVAASNNA